MQPTLRAAKRFREHISSLKADLLDKKKAMRTQKGARERREGMRLAQALLNTACA